MKYVFSVGIHIVHSTRIENDGIGGFGHDTVWIVQGDLFLLRAELEIAMAPFVAGSFQRHRSFREALFQLQHVPFVCVFAFVQTS